MQRSQDHKKTHSKAETEAITINTPTRPDGNASSIPPQNSAAEKTRVICDEAEASFYERSARGVNSATPVLIAHGHKSVERAFEERGD